MEGLGGIIAQASLRQETKRASRIVHTPVEGRGAGDSAIAAGESLSSPVLASTQSFRRGSVQRRSLRGVREDSLRVRRVIRGSSQIGLVPTSPTARDSVNNIDSGALAFYCQDCGQLCCVDDLILDGPHKQHEYIYAVEQAAVTCDELTALAGPAQKARGAFDEKVALVRQRISELEEMCAERAQTIDQRFAALTKRLERRREGMQRELSQTRERKLAPLQDLLQRMSAVAEKADSALQQLVDARRELETLPPGPVSPNYAARQKLQQLQAAEEGREEGAQSANIPSPGASQAALVRSADSIIEEPEEDCTAGGSRQALSMRSRLREKERQAQQEARKKRMPGQRRQPPTALSPALLVLVRTRAQLVQALQAQTNCAFTVPDTDAIDVVFNVRVETDLDTHGRVAVSLGGFRPTSRANFGGTVLRPGAAAQGVIWWLGTKGGEEEFRNPAEHGLLQLTSSAIFSKGNKRVLSSREPRDCFIGSVHGSTVSLFLGRGRRLVPSHYALTHGGCAGSPIALRSWILEGAACSAESDIAGPWFTVMVHVNDDALGVAHLNTHLWKIEPVCHRAYQHFRIRMTGPNAATDPRQQWVLCLAGIELYGTLYEDG